VRLAAREACVSELAEDEGEKITTVSARLKTLFSVRLVKWRHEAKHFFHALVDENLLPMIRNAIDHAAEGRTAVSADLGQGKDIIS
jgi:ArsR family transcriptional regulator, lead/cadmium/zinc/bismuth-responsive transcriptional repressor